MASSFTPIAVRLPKHQESRIPRSCPEVCLVISQIQKDTAVSVRVEAQVRDVHDVR